MHQYMNHPLHGWITVSSEQEIETHKKNGWVVKERNDKKPEVKKPEKKAESPEEAYFLKFGKKPHHKMTLENIIKALED